METEQHGKNSYKLTNPVMVTSVSDDLAFSIIMVLQEQQAVQKKLLIYRERTRWEDGL